MPHISDGRPPTESRVLCVGTSRRSVCKLTTTPTTNAETTVHVVVITK